MTNIHEGEGDFSNGQYYDKGGHRQRSLWHRAITKLRRRPIPIVQQEKDNRRKMPRMPNNGKRKR